MTTAHSEPRLTQGAQNKQTNPTAHGGQTRPLGPPAGDPHGERQINNAEKQVCFPQGARACCLEVKPAGQGDTCAQTDSGSGPGPRSPPLLPKNVPSGEGWLPTAHPEGWSAGGAQQNTEGTAPQVGKGRAVSGAGSVTKEPSWAVRPRLGAVCLSPPPPPPGPFLCFRATWEPGRAWRGRAAKTFRGP